ncbi:GAPES1 domain-containing protein, partial [Salmonella enterica]|uniref:GAPES1 domain-containing protein n=1 Tax=Salmonella enterica TaxID=28901 RepID=UPI00373FCF8A
MCVRSWREPFSRFCSVKSQNQSIAAHLMRPFEAPGAPVTAENPRAFCDAFEAINGTHGVTLPRHNYPALHGTLQTAATQCTDNLDDALLLPAFDQAVSINRSQDDH